MVAVSSVLALVAFVAVRGELITSDRLPLSTKGKEIVDNAGEAVKLSCVNWYGSHMEQHAVSGLHKQSLSNITERVIELGFNCIRLPFSLQLLTANPVVPDIVLEANPDLKGLRGMELLDVVMEEFRQKNLLVVLNNHNSRSGWCCDVESEEGLWNTPAYSTDTWVETLGNYTRRYKSFSNVIAFDLRNEIHDVGSKVITWGTSSDKDTDWKVASELAARRVQEENPDILVVVSGLCFGNELRPILDDPPQLMIKDKLVYTTHTYGYTIWWRLIEDRTLELESAELLATVLMALLPVVFIVSIAFSRKLQPCRSSVRSALLFWSFLICVIFMFCGILWRVALSKAGCLVMAPSADLCTYLSAALAGLFGVSWLANLWYLKGSDQADQQVSVVDKLDQSERGEDTLGTSKSAACGKSCALVHVSIASVVFWILSVALFLFAKPAQTYDMQRWDFETKWRHDDASTPPIWIGEFGGNNRNDPWWGHMIQFLNETDMDWAYWALDGQRFYPEFSDTGVVIAGHWEDETYGILDNDYVTLRHPEMLQDLQTVM